VSKPLLLMLLGLFTVRLLAKRFGDSALIDETRPILMAGRDRLTAVPLLMASRRRMEQFDKAFG